jgi:hypothetical protein
MGANFHTCPRCNSWSLLERWRCKKCSLMNVNAPSANDPIYRIKIPHNGDEIMVWIYLNENRSCIGMPKTIKEKYSNYDFYHFDVIFSPKITKEQIFKYLVLL